MNFTLYRLTFISRIQQKECTTAGPVISFEFEGFLFYAAVFARSFL